jgi:amino acid adenylation domain-containing protein
MLTDAQRSVLTSRLRRGRDSVPGAIARRPAGLTELPLSCGQEQLWFIDRFAPGQPVYNIPLAIGLTGQLDQAALSRAIDALVARHEALRTRLVAAPDGRPAQVIDPPGPQPLTLTDLSSLAPGPRQARLAEFIGAQAHLPFALAADRLLRTSLIRLDAAEHLLLAVVHHAVFDGWSVRVLVAELAALYRQEAAGEPAVLADLPVQFADYAVWERDRLTDAATAGLRQYWHQVLDGFETAQFPTDRPRPVIDDFRGALVQRLTAGGLLDGLRELSRREGTTPFVVLMAALHVLVHRYTGQTDLVIGTVSANRTRAELTHLIGFLVNTLPVRADLSGDPPFTELLACLHRATADGYAHQDLPFAKIVETLQVERDPGRSPVFQIALAYAERDSKPVRAAGVDVAMTDLVVGINAAKFDLNFLAEARQEGLWLECCYKTALFGQATAERLVTHFEVLLHGIIADPAARLSALPVLTPAELRSELALWNDTAALVPPRCVHQGFEAQAAATPGAVAAEYETEQISYAELNRQANQIARRLAELGTGPETLIGVCMTTSLRRLAALLGIWKAGGGYVPLDPALPADRLAFMIADTAMPVILTDQASAGRLPGGGATTLSLDAHWDRITCLDGSDPTGVAVSPANAAYVIYTSGSTGRPKGVLVEHRQVANFLHGMVRTWQIGPSDAVLQFAAFTFDVSVLDMFMPLMAGGKVVLAPAETLHSPPRLAALLTDRTITFASLPPAVLNLLGDQQLPDLRVLMPAGEELPSDLASRWIRPGLRLVNGYGPTETTVIAAHAELDATMIPPPIGLPTWPNYRGYVLDQYLNPVPTGVTGELHIGGASVARGYLHRPALTAQRFIADPFTPGQRLYKTGDLARRRPDGAIVYAGRIDHQIKINGLRIELGEIETALAAHAGVDQAVVTVVTDPGGARQLAGYLRPAPGTRPDLPGLRAHLAGIVPAYMIPAHLIAVDEFPLNASGKVDRAALPAPRPPESGQHTAPATFMEAVLADMYATILHREEVSATDSFFDLGGSSLAVMALIAHLASALAVDLDVSAVFLAPTPRQLAGLLRDKHGFDDADLGAGGSELTSVA